MEKRTLYLKAGGYLELEEGFVRYVSSGGTPVSLTKAQQIILATLIEADGKTVPYDELYQKYAGHQGVDDANQYLSKIKNRIKSPEIKKCICAVSGMGYRFDTSRIESDRSDLASASAPAPAEEGRWLRKLVGDYYGFYLDAVGDGSVLGAYFHLEERDGEIIANAILGIQSDEVLRHAKLSGIFLDPMKCYRQNYQEAIRGFSENDQRCFFAEGTVTAHRSMAIITMNTELDEKWSIVLDAAAFLDVDKRRKDTQHPYRGGMGIMVTLARSHGNFCSRCGLVRLANAHPNIVLENPTLKKLLKLLGDDEKEARGQHLRMDRDRDQTWYNWFMKGAKADTTP